MAVFFACARIFSSLLQGAEQTRIDQGNRRIICHGLKHGLGIAGKLTIILSSHDQQTDNFILDLDRDYTCRFTQRSQFKLLQRQAVHQQTLPRERHQ